MHRTVTRLMGVVATSLLALCAAPTAGTAAGIHPAGGSTFDGGPQGWVGSGTSCSILSGAASLCSASTEHTVGVGNPGDSIASRTTVTLNLLSIFQGKTTWTSPSFTLPAGVAVGAGGLTVDRRFEPGSVLNLGPQAGSVVKLVDKTAGTTTDLLTETLGQADTTFATRTAPVPAGVLVPGHEYELKIDTTITTTLLSLGLLGSSAARYDNVALVVLDAPGTGPGTGTGTGSGTGGPAVSPGVALQSGPISDASITNLFNSVNWNAEVGNGPGGSVIPRNRCTFVGTPGTDRIVGTAGNDVICGLGGDDRIDGAGGMDLIDTANGTDSAKGGAGKDMLIGVRGSDRLSGGAAADRVGGGAGKDSLNGGAGNDRLGGGSGNDVLTGGTGRDRLSAGAGRDRLLARDGSRDRLDGGRGRDSARVDRSSRRRDVVRRVERR